MRALLIGGTGFIGPHVVGRMLERGHSVAVLHRVNVPRGLPDEVRHLTGNRNDLSACAGQIARFAPDVVIDLIAATEAQARHLMNMLEGVAGRVVALSSGDVYRATGVFSRFESGPPEHTPLAEDAPLRTRHYLHRGGPFEPDSWISPDYEKILVEREVMNHRGLPAVVVRLPMTYGPGDTNRRWHPYLKRMDDGRRAILLNHITAEWRGPWGYVENVAEAVALAAQHDGAAGRVYNVAERESLTMKEMLRELAHAAGWTGEIAVTNKECPPPDLCAAFDGHQHLWMNTARIREELGYRESVTQEEAWRRTVEWERAHPPTRIDPALFDYPAEDRILSGRLL